jgi:hypothetical protein
MPRLAATLAAKGRALTVSPKSGTNYEAVRSVCREGGTHYDESLRCEVLQIKHLGDLVPVAVKYGLTLYPHQTAIDAVREEAARIREEATFLDRIGSDVELRNYQGEGVGFLWKNPRAMLLDEMGLGKTVQALCALLPDAATIVVCPASVRGVWYHETKRWRQDLTPEIVDSFRYPEPGELLIINPERLPDDVDRGAPWPGTHLIIDEAHLFKNGRSKRTGRMRKIITRVVKRHGYIWVLTGTPVLNKPPELWALLALLQLHTRCYGSFTKFAKALGGVDDGLGHWAWSTEINPKAIDPIKPYALRRARLDVLTELPPKSYSVRYIPSPEGELLRKLNALDGDNLITSLESDREPVDQGAIATTRKELAMHKFSHHLAEIEAQEFAGVPLVVFSAHKGPIKELEKREGWAAIHGEVPPKKRTEIVADFQKGRYLGLGCTIDTGSLGLTLTYAADVHFIDETWVPGKNLQAQDRVCRFGQTRPVIVTRVVCEHPLDLRIAQVLESKMRIIEGTTDQLTSKPHKLSRQELATQLDQLASLMSKT